VLQSKKQLLASVYFSNKNIGFLSRCFYRRILTAQGNAEYIDKLLQNFNPSEVLIQKNKNNFRELLG
jgi:DNA mismatch repair protein MutS